MKQLLTSLTQLNQVLHGVANGITVQDATGKLVFVNQAAARMMNCASPEAAVEKGGAGILKGFKFYDEHMRPITPADFPGRHALQGVREPEMLIAYTTDDKASLHWTIVKAMPVLDEHGQVTLAVNVLQDVTHLKETETRLKEANARITKLLEQALNVS